MNIMSTLGEEVDKGGENFDEEDETFDDISDSSENKVIVRMRDKKSLSRPQSDETSRVRWMSCVHSFIQLFNKTIMPVVDLPHKINLDHF